MNNPILPVLVFVLTNLWAAGQEVTGLLGAFPPELVLLKNKMADKKDTIIQNIAFTRGTLNGKAVVLAQTGIGKVNAAITTTLLIEHFKPHEIIFSGIAGGVDSALEPGDIVIATQVAYHDYGTVTDTGMRYSPTRNTLNTQLNPFYFTCDTGLLIKAMKAAGKLAPGKIERAGGRFAPVIKQGTIVTGDVFVASALLTHRLRTYMHAAATDMESAAVGQTCWQQNIPFLVIRSMSDKANSQAGKDMMLFYEIAASNAAMLVEGIVKELN